MRAAHRAGTFAHTQGANGPEHTRVPARTAVAHVYAGVRTHPLAHHGPTGAGTLSRRATRAAWADIPARAAVVGIARGVGAKPTAERRGTGATGRAGAAASRTRGSSRAGSRRASAASRCPGRARVHASSPRAATSSTALSADSRAARTAGARAPPRIRCFPSRPAAATRICIGLHARRETVAGSTSQRERSERNGNPERRPTANFRVRQNFTRVGIGAGSLALYPQQNTAPSARHAQVLPIGCRATCFTSAMAETSVGARRSVVVPSPTWPP